MSAALKTKLTLAEYLVRENAADFKSDFYRGEVFAMAGANRHHNAINENLSIKIGGKLEGSRCRTYSRDYRVVIDRSGLVTYPDLLIVCGEPIPSPQDPHSVTNPTVIIEVLSKTTETYDRGLKFKHFQLLASLQEYVLVSQTEPRIERFTRQADNTWILTNFEGVEQMFSLTAVPVELPMKDIYRDVTFDPNNE